ncbi:MAG: formate dehydrogenase accessory sulfurtransferase FdhD, partial [Anaerolineales bacterium]|nr:formate dehydrogenase accessory sulfurtransferase FdhD [Anaerolineales bacterium]
NEGIVKNREEVDLVQICSHGDNIDVWLNHSVEQPKQWRRTSGCTGGATAVILEGLHPELRNGFVLAPQTINRLVEMLINAQELYREVGGVHTSVLSDGERAVVSAEDVGRHNSLDKISGRCLLDAIQLPRRILVTTGRISSEMIQKAARIGASIVVSRTSATSLSVMMAEKWGITLVGYARRDQFIVYTHPERILQTEAVFEKTPLKEAGFKVKL